VNHTIVRILSLFAFTFICAPVTASSSLVNLSCVDREKSNFEMIVVFDPLNQRLIVPSGVKDVAISEHTIQFTQESNVRYETTIYRSTGRYTVWAKDPSTKETIATFGGTCSKKTKNKF